jgi:signal transduction histidine kinase
MKNYIILLTLYLLTATKLIAQVTLLDSLKIELSKASSDQARFVIYNDIGDFIAERLFYYDSAMYFYKQADELAKKNGQELLDGLCITKLARCAYFSQDAIKSYNAIQKGFDLVGRPEIINGKYWGFNNIPPENLRLIELGWLNWLMGHFQREKLDNNKESIDYFHQGKKLSLAAHALSLIGHCNGSILYSFLVLNQPDSALAYGRELEQNINFTPNYDIYHFMEAPDKYPWYLKDIGAAHLKLNNKPLFLKYLWTSISLALNDLDTGALIGDYKMLNEFYLSEKNEDSSFYYAKELSDYDPGGYNLYESLYKCYELKNQSDSTAKYMKLTLAALDEYDQHYLETIKEIQRVSFQKQVQLQALEKEKIENEGKLKTFSIIALIVIFSTIGFLLYRNNQRQKKARAIIERSYNQLKSTQAQLIQSEKMASLGELTAGIAHEIQNPLNFVNNFSEVNKEMIDEATEEINKGNYDEVKIILNDVKDNSEKILHHGKRADAIVKGMLQHSRANTGKKEPTDINALADEYLRLSYHGMRAKDKSFNAEIKTDFDESIGKINVVPQDIGRVLLNFFNNAFYAVNEKQKAESAKLNAKYKATVSIQTKKLNDKIEIKVEDNGTGIPQKVVDKIFQPFFTTKPTGQGTGLGLSLSYDIIKAHGGEIKVESKEGEGSEFIILLPV